MSNKILFLLSAMNSGGAERVASTLANAWTAEGNQVTLMPTFSGRGECFYELSPNVRLIYLADLVSSHVRSLANQFARLSALRRFMITEKPDVIVSFLSNVNVATVIASLGLNIPVIISERIDPFVMPMPRKLQFACRLTYPFANALVVQTQAVANKYIDSGWPLKRLCVISNPVAEQPIKLQKRNNVSKAKRLLSIGRLDEQKQFNVLIKQFAKLVQNHPNWTLRIIGEGSLRSVLQQQIIDLDLCSHVELAGTTPSVSKELAQADIFALTSKYEGFPNVLLEAMAAGLPAVSFDCPSGPREISMDGQMALLVAPNDEQALACALERLMLDADLRQTLGEQARKSVIERYSLSAVLKKWDELFAEIGVTL